MKLGSALQRQIQGNEKDTLKPVADKLEATPSGGARISPKNSSASSVASDGDIAESDVTSKKKKKKEEKDAAAAAAATTPAGPRASAAMAEQPPVAGGEGTTAPAEDAAVVVADEGPQLESKGEKIVANRPSAATAEPAGDGAAPADEQHQDPGTTTTPEAAAAAPNKVQVPEELLENTAPDGKRLPPEKGPNTTPEYVSQAMKQINNLKHVNASIRGSNGPGEDTFEAVATGNTEEAIKINVDRKSMKRTDTQEEDYQGMKPAAGAGQGSHPSGAPDISKSLTKSQITEVVTASNPKSKQNVSYTQTSLSKYREDANRSHQWALPGAGKDMLDEVAQKLKTRDPAKIQESLNRLNEKLQETNRDQAIDAPAAPLGNDPIQSDAPPPSGKGEEEPAIPYRPPTTMQDELPAPEVSYQPPDKPAPTGLSAYDSAPAKTDYLKNPINRNVNNPDGKIALGPGGPLNAYPTKAANTDYLNQKKASISPVAVTPMGTNTAYPTKAADTNYLSMNKNTGTSAGAVTPLGTTGYYPTKAADTNYLGMNKAAAGGNSAAAVTPLGTTGYYPTKAADTGYLSTMKNKDGGTSAGAVVPLGTGGTAYATKPADMGYLGKHVNAATIAAPSSGTTGGQQQQIVSNFAADNSSPGGVVRASAAEKILSGPSTTTPGYTSNQPGAAGASDQSMDSSADSGEEDTTTTDAAGRRIKKKKEKKEHKHKKEKKEHRHKSPQVTTTSATKSRAEPQHFNRTDSNSGMSLKDQIAKNKQAKVKAWPQPKPPSSNAVGNNRMPMGLPTNKTFTPLGFNKPLKGITNGDGAGNKPQRLDIEAIRAGMKNPAVKQEGPEDWSAKLKPSQPNEKPKDRQCSVHADEAGLQDEQRVNKFHEPPPQDNPVFAKKKLKVVAKNYDLDGFGKKEETSQAPAFAKFQLRTVEKKPEDHNVKEEPKLNSMPIAPPKTGSPEKTNNFSPFQKQLARGAGGGNIVIPSKGFEDDNVEVIVSTNSSMGGAAAINASLNNNQQEQQLPPTKSGVLLPTPTSSAGTAGLLSQTASLNKDQAAATAATEQAKITGSIAEEKRAPLKFGNLQADAPLEGINESFANNKARPAPQSASPIFQKSDSPPRKSGSKASLVDPSQVLSPAQPPNEIQSQIAANKLESTGNHGGNKTKPPAEAVAEPQPAKEVVQQQQAPPPKAAEPPAPPVTKTPPPYMAPAPTANPGDGSDPLRDHFMAFFESNEVMKVLESFDNFQQHCEQRLREKNVDPKSFETKVAMLAAAAELSGLSFRMKKVINDLVPMMKKRKASKPLKDPNMQVIVSGAGPVGLHTALDIYMLGFANVTVVEKRNTFSRHNILTMWACTAEHVQVVYNCREFFPLFSHRDKLPHLGTRELQLTLLKCGLLVGVKYLYNWETIGLEAPPVSGSSGTWTVGLKKPAGRVEPTGVLDLKAGKFEDAKARAADGACGMIEVNTFDPTFAVSNGKLAASKPDMTISADVLVLAEGETSANSKKLGFTKKIQKFSRAIAIVLNLWRDAKNKAENKVQDFTVQGAFNSPAATALKAAGIDFEFMEYLRGTTHYVAICVMKKTLLSKKVCKEDIGGKDFIGRDNISEENLFKLGREIVTAIGLPTTVPFCDFHGAKMFDFGSRSSLPLPFRILGESTATPGKILSMDYSAEPRLAFVETNFLEKTIAWLDRTCLERRHGLQFVSDTQKARETTTIEKFEAEKQELKEQLNGFNADLAMVKKENPNPKKLLPIFPVGDALMEPFWPQGTGINRGFHTGTDASFCILQYNMDQDLSQALLSADFCYRQKSCLLLGPELNQKVEDWNSRPWSRYLNLAGNLQSYTMTDQELATVKTAAIDLDQKTRLQCIENPWPVIPNYVGKPGPLQKFVLTAITPEEDREKIQIAFKDALYIPRPIKAFGRSCCPRAIEKKVTKKELKADAKNAMKEDKAAMKGQGMGYR
ncbi:unnamed protein product [Amoebophrya sp. A120]|nr:unnamed protein product [Amoebophrya sp. A120]|eukprot:GSA120T00019519001.1